MLAAFPAGFAPLVVDNGSTDGSAEVARRLGARVVSEPRRGFGAACCAGLSAAAVRAGLLHGLRRLAGSRASCPRVTGPVLDGRWTCASAPARRIPARGLRTRGWPTARWPGAAPPQRGHGSPTWGRCAAPRAGHCSRWVCRTAPSAGRSRWCCGQPRRGWRIGEVAGRLPARVPAGDPRSPAASAGACARSATWAPCCASRMTRLANPRLPRLPAKPRMPRLPGPPPGPVPPGVLAQPTARTVADFVPRLDPARSLIAVVARHRADLALGLPARARPGLQRDRPSRRATSAR